MLGLPGITFKRFPVSWKPRVGYDVSFNLLDLGKKRERSLVGGSAMRAILSDPFKRPFKAKKQILQLLAIILR